MTQKLLIMSCYWKLNYGTLVMMHCQCQYIAALWKIYLETTAVVTVNTGYRSQSRWHEAKEWNLNEEMWGYVINQGTWRTAVCAYVHPYVQNTNAKLFTIHQGVGPSFSHDSPKILRT